jgi:SWI/SNF-related matrix-associated actin-dependent regulator of chromatin subfamily A member 5
MYKQILNKNIDVVNGVSKDKIQLLNILMQLKKVCNHPYLFPKIEKGPPYIEGEHLISNSMKLKVLDVLLKKIKNENGKVLIFSQMTTLLNILDDYCRYRGFLYCRIDGSTSSEDRDKRIEDFQSRNSDKFIFLLSTRAGGLGINLHSANVVIIYDSDWNPQVDLQAIDRAHRIGQTRPVTIYRFVTEGTVEEKIVERAAKKLKIDHLIIQRGKPIQNKVTALEMTSIIQFGVDKLFSLNDDTTEKDIEEILEYSITKTEKVNEHLKSIEEKLNINNLSLNANSKNIYQFEGEDYKKRSNEEVNSAQMFVSLSYSLGQRERKLINSNLEVKKCEFKKQKSHTGWRAKIGGGYLHQFYDHATLDYLDEKENLWKDYFKRKEDGDNEIEEIPEEFTNEDSNYREELIKQGFSKWNKKDFTRFLRACEVFGLNDYENISKSMKTKTHAEVEEYVRVFQERVEELPGGSRIVAKINKFESEKNKIIEYQNILDELFEEVSNSNDDIFNKIKIPYKCSKTKYNSEL